MTVATIRSKKSERRRTVKALTRVLLFYASLSGPVADAAVSAAPRLPIIQNVGVIPVQWQGASAEAHPGQREQWSRAFGDAVRASHRFRVISDDLIAELWATADGRAELKADFELQSLIALQLSQRGDSVDMTARLLGPDLKTLLLESDAVALEFLLRSEPKAFYDRVESLVFRLLNRLPVDVSVTSVQGNYITLSGGTEQGVRNGDLVDLVRTTVTNLHPANGTWLEFGKRPIGTAEVLETKTYTAVARISAQTEVGTIVVGDGARIAAISGRLKFARLASNAGFVDSGQPASIIVPPVPATAQTVKVMASAPAKDGSAVDGKGSVPPPAEDSSPGPKAKVATGDEAQAEPEPKEGGEASEGAAENGPSVWDDVSADVKSHKAVELAEFYFGPSWWAFGGDRMPAARGQFPLWLVNSFGGGVVRTMIYRLKGAFGGGLLFGRTDSSGYLGYEGQARLYWEDALDAGDGFFKFWRAGVTGRLSGIGVDSGKFGGGDWLRGGAFGGIGGRITTDGGPRYDWFTEFSLMTLDIGRVGYLGDRFLVESALGWKLSVGGYEAKRPGAIQWGGAVDFAAENATLDNGRRPQIQEYALKVLARWSL